MTEKKFQYNLCTWKTKTITIKVKVTFIFKEEPSEQCENKKYFPVYTKSLTDMETKFKSSMH